MNAIRALALSSIVAAPASAQLLTINIGGGEITAEADQALLDTFVGGYNLVSFFDFTLVGDVSNLAVGAQYQSPIFGFVADDATKRIQGQADNPPLGAFNSTNPVLLGTYEGTLDDIIVNGQFDGAFQGTGFFPTAFNYQNADGSAGTVAFEIIPAPASAALFGLAGLVATRRR